MKGVKRALVFVLALTLMTLPAMAASSHDTLGVYGLTAESGYTLTPLKADGSAPDRYSGQFDDGVSTVYEGVEKFELSFTGTSDKQYVVFLLSSNGTVPTESNIAYIDQTGGTTTIEFTLFPYQLESGTYNVYLSGTDFSYTKVASFNVTNSWEEAPYTLGDVNQDGRITAADASLVLRAATRLETLTETQLAAAKVSSNGDLPTANDAATILRYATRLIDKFPNED